MGTARFAAAFLALAFALFPLGGLAQTSEEKVTPVKPPASEAEVEAWKLMVGTWYGTSSTHNGGLVQRLAEKYPDGTYKVRFRIHAPGGEIFERTEVGHWGISGDIYFAIYRGRIEGEELVRSDPSDPYNYDAYKILSLTENRFEYEHVSNGNRYAVERVGPDFEFPEQRLQ